MTFRTQQETVKKIRDGMTSARSIVNNLEKVNNNGENASALDRANSIGGIISAIASIAGAG